MGGFALLFVFEFSSLLPSSCFQISNLALCCLCVCASCVFPCLKEPKTSFEKTEEGNWNEDRTIDAWKRRRQRLDFGKQSRQSEVIFASTLWEHVILPAYDELTAVGGPAEGATVVHQEDNAAPPHQEGDFHAWLTAEFTRRGWRLELQAPQGPYTNVLDLQVNDPYWYMCFVTFTID